MAALGVVAATALSQGVQPDAAGASVETARGYPGLLYAALRAANAILAGISGP